MGLREVFGDTVLTGTTAAAGASSGPIANPGVINDIIVLTHVSAITGTSPTLSVAVEQSDDNSTYTAVTGGSGANITAAGSQSINCRVTKPYVRVTTTIGGTTPAVTYRVSALVFSN